MVLAESTEDARKKTEEYVASRPRTKDKDDKPIVLYHYTDDKGLLGITTSMSLNPSLTAELGGRPRDAQHGSGHYFTDIKPHTMSHNDLAILNYGVPWLDRVKNFIAIDVKGLAIENPKTNLFIHRTTKRLDITERLLSFGLNRGR